MSEPTDYWLIWSNEHGAWWRPDSCGYTTIESEAGRYTLKEAQEICRDSTVTEGLPHEVMKRPSVAIDTDRRLAYEIMKRYDLGLTSSDMEEIERELSQKIAAHVSEELETQRRFFEDSMRDALRDKNQVIARLESYLAGTPASHVEACFLLAEELGHGASSEPPIEYVRGVIERMKQSHADRVGQQACDLERLAKEIAEWERGAQDVWRKLGDGTLHQLHCNASHNGPVGGSGCSCTLGRVIKQLRHERDQALAKLEKLSSVGSSTTQETDTRIWGTIYGNNLKRRAYYSGDRGKDDKEPWYTDDQGDQWSGFDVRFVPDGVTNTAEKQT